MVTTARSIGRLRAALFATTAVVSLLGVAAETARYRFGVDSQLVPLLSLSEEGNLPTWYSSALLLACAIALAAVAAEVRRLRAPLFRSWAALAAIFAYLSLDETAQIHERLHDVVHLRGGVFYFNWIVPASVIVLAVGLAYLRFWWRLPPPTRRRFLVAGVIYIGGALLMEMPLGAWAARHGEENLGYALIDAVEETLEMVGAALFLVAVLQHRRALVEEAA